MTEEQAKRVQLETRLGLLNFSLSNSTNSEHIVKIQAAIRRTEQELSGGGK